MIDPLQNAKDFRHQDFRKELDKAEFWRGVKTTLFFLFLLYTGAFFLGVLTELIN